MRPSTEHELSDADALAFHRHCVALEIEQACKPAVDDKHIRTVLREGGSPFTLAHQHRVAALDPDKRVAAKLSHDTVMLRAGLALGFIDPVTGRMNGQ